MEDFQMSAETDQLFSALVEALPEIPTVPKNGKAPRNKHRLVDDILDAVKPILRKHGLFITLSPIGKAGLNALLGHRSGQFMKFRMEFPDFPGSAHMSPQHALGGDITYFKRYMLDAILGIVSEEDTDGDHSYSPQQNHSPKQEFKASPNKPSSAPQHNLIKRLSREKNKGHVGEILSLFGITNEEKLVSLNAAQASELIEELQKLENI